MPLPDRIYRRTALGDKALTQSDTTRPLEYQRILALVSEDTHTDVVRGCLRQFSDELLADWLAEMEEVGYLTSTTADTTQDLDFTALAAPTTTAAKPVASQDKERIETQVRSAATALGDKGAFLSPDRLKNRQPVKKDASDITVLVVEDDPDQAAIAELRINMAGYKVRQVANRKQLIDELKVRPLPDLMLLDIRLPDGDGFEILEAMRRQAALALMPVVMLTAVTGQSNVRRGLALGADGYITKPYSKNVLAQTILDVLKHNL